MESQRNKIQKIIDQRVYSLVDDGYMLKVKYKWGSVQLYKLMHRFNRSVILIKADTIANNMKQWTNDKLVYNSTIYNKL